MNYMSGEKIKIGDLVACKYDLFDLLEGELGIVKSINSKMIMIFWPNQIGIFIGGMVHMYNNEIVFVRRNGEKLLTWM